MSGAPADTARSAKTKAAIMDAAEHLMARHGIEGAELQEIHRTAGQRNQSAVAYHFGDRDGLLVAMGVRRREPVNAARNRCLDALERDGDVTVRSVVDALVRPTAVDLTTAGGRDYLVVLAESAARVGSMHVLDVDLPHVDSVHRVHEHLVQLLPGSRDRRRRMSTWAIVTTPVLLADIAREITRGRITVAQGKRQVGDVVDFLTSALS